MQYQTDIKMIDHKKPAQNCAGFFSIGIQEALQHHAARNFNALGVHPLGIVCA